MASVQVMISIGIIIISFVASFIFFYMVSSLPKEEKKMHLEEIVSLMINFIIFIWIGKIIINFSIFIRDPLAVLAYPSDSLSFYFAVLFTVIHLIYRMRRHGFDVGLLLTSFIPIFLVANFIYEFIQSIWNENTYNFPYMALLGILIVLYLILFEKIPQKTSFILVLSWCVGQLLLSLKLPYIKVFSYMISPWFLVVMLMFALIFSFYCNRKKVT